MSESCRRNPPPSQRIIQDLLPVNIWSPSELNRIVSQRHSSEPNSVPLAGAPKTEPLSRAAASLFDAWNPSMEYYTRLNYAFLSRLASACSSRWPWSPCSSSSPSVFLSNLKGMGDTRSLHYFRRNSKVSETSYTRLTMQAWNETFLAIPLVCELVTAWTIRVVSLQHGSL